MKTKLFLLLALFSVSVFANTRSESEALELASKAMTEIRSNQSVHNDHLRRVAKPTSEAMRLKMTCKKPDSQEPAVYVFGSQKDDGGYVVISADDRTEAVLGFADKGSFDADNIPANMQVWLEMYADEISRLPQDFQAKTSTKTYTPVSPLITAEWGQDEPYNILCPTVQTKRTVTGCVATAVAQVMHYWKYPAHGVGKFTSKCFSDTMTIDVSSTYYDWANMLDKYYDVVSTPAQDTAVAQLMYHVGRAANMNYGSSSSGAVTQTLIRRLHQCFAYDANIRVIDKDHSNIGYMLDQIAAELAAKRPIVMDGAASKNDAHAFVCDGIREDGYLHINWGWNGHYNGYFRLTVLNSDELDDVHYNGSGGLGYSKSDCKAFLGIQPEQGGAWTPHIAAGAQSITKERLARTDQARVSITGMYSTFNETLKSQFCAVLWDGNTIVNTYPMGDKFDVEYSYYSGGYQNIPISQFPMGAYQLQFGLLVDGFTGVVPINVYGVGEYKYDILVTSDSVWFEGLDRTINLRIYVDSTCTADVGDTMSLNLGGEMGSDLKSNHVAIRQSDGSYLASIKTNAKYISIGLTELGSDKKYTYNYIPIVTESSCYTLTKREENAGRYSIYNYYIYPYEGDCIYPATTAGAYLPAVEADTVRYMVTTESSFGSIKGAGSYVKGANVFLTGVPTEGGHFLRWEDGGTENPRMLTVIKDTLVKAQFSDPSQVYYTVTTVAQNGVVEGGGLYKKDTTIVLTATPNIGYQFTSWSDGVTDNPRQVKVTADSTFTAQFAVLMCDVRASGANGIVTGSGTYQQGTTVTLTATPNEGYRFVRWGDGVTTNPRTFVLMQDTLLTARFANGITVKAKMPDDWTEQISIYVYGDGQGNRWVTPEQQNDWYVFHTTGSRVFMYYVNGSTTSIENTNCTTDLTFTDDACIQIGSADGTNKRNYSQIDCGVEPLDTFIVTATCDHGTISGTGKYISGMSATLTVTPVSGYEFTAWNDGNTDNPRTIVVTQDTVLQAMTTKSVVYYTITTLATNGSVTGGGTYKEDTTITLTATPNQGYQFTAWNDGNTDNPRQVKVTADATYMATFTAVLCQVLTNATNGSVTGGGIYAYGTSVTLTATANAGYEFVDWNDGVTDNPRTIILNQDTTFTARFKEIILPPTDSIMVKAKMPSDWGNTISAWTWYDTEGTWVTPTKEDDWYVYTTANDALNIVFVNGTDWSTNTNQSVDIILTEDACIQLGEALGNAKRSYTIIDCVTPPSPQQFTIATFATNGTVTGAGTYEENSVVTLTATANAGYEFVDWNDGVTDNPRTIVLTQDTTFTARFKEIVIPPTPTDSITVKAKMPSDWGNTISAWTWYDTEAGWAILTKEDDWYVYTTANDALNIVFVNGIDWSTNTNQSVDIILTEDACIQLGEALGNAKRSYTIIDCVTPPSPKQFSITTFATNGTVTGAGTYEENSVVTLTATANAGYEFVDWNDGVTDNPRTIVLTQDTTFTARFKEIVIPPTPTDSITVKAKMPSDWGNTISAWTWYDTEADWAILTKDGDWYVYTTKHDALNIVFLNGTEWSGDDNQTVDIILTQDACIQIGESTGAKRTYTNIDCQEQPEETSRYLRDYVTKEVLATFGAVGGNDAYLVAEVELVQDTNRVEITQYINAYSTAWYGPKWDGYKSSLADAEGYCWWTCPQFDATGKITAPIASGSGTNNHIGLIIPKGEYRFTFDSRGTKSDFVLEQLNETAVEDASSPSKPIKVMRDGQLLIIINGKTYNAMGAEL